MNEQAIRARLHSIEEQIRVLKAEVKAASRKKKQPRTFADLYGIWRGKVDLSFEEVQAAEIKFRDAI